ncbi:hypothetical protein QUC31_001853 [Theobroma cacao]
MEKRKNSAQQGRIIAKGITMMEMEKAKDDARRLSKGEKNPDGREGNCGVLLLGRGPIPVLKNLTYLKINRCYHEGWERLLDYTPFLETLVFALEVESAVAVISLILLCGSHGFNLS